MYTIRLFLHFFQSRHHWYPGDLGDLRMERL